MGRRRPVGRGIWPWHARCGQRAGAGLAAPPDRPRGPRHRAGARLRAATRLLGARESRTAGSATRSSCWSGPRRPGGGSSSATSTTTRGPRAPGRRSPDRSAARSGPPGTSRGSCRDRARAGRGQGAGRGTGEDPARPGGRATRSPPSSRGAPCSTPSRPAARRSAGRAACSPWTATSPTDPATPGSPRRWTDGPSSRSGATVSPSASWPRTATRRSLSGPRSTRAWCRSGWTPPSSPRAPARAGRRAGPRQVALGPGRRRRMVGARPPRPRLRRLLADVADVDLPRQVGLTRAAIEAHGLPRGARRPCHATWTPSPTRRAVGRAGSRDALRRPASGAPHGEVAGTMTQVVVAAPGWQHVLGLP